MRSAMSHLHTYMKAILQIVSYRIVSYRIVSYRKVWFLHSVIVVSCCTVGGWCDITNGQLQVLPKRLLLITIIAARRVSSSSSPNSSHYWCRERIELIRRTSVVVCNWMFTEWSSNQPSNQTNHRIRTLSLRCGRSTGVDRLFVDSMHEFVWLLYVWLSCRS